MEKSLEKFFSEKLPQLKWVSAKAVLALVADGGTVPFIARYRKEKTNNMDEVQVRNVIDCEKELKMPDRIP